MSEMNRANTIIRDSLDSSFSQITVDDETMFNEIRNYIRVIDPRKEKSSNSIGARCPFSTISTSRSRSSRSSPSTCR